MLVKMLNQSYLSKYKKQKNELKKSKSSTCMVTCMVAFYNFVKSGLQLPFLLNHKQKPIIKLS